MYLQCRQVIYEKKSPYIRESLCGREFRWEFSLEYALLGLHICKIEYYTYVRLLWVESLVQLGLFKTPIAHQKIFSVCGVEQR
jgi:hypothetical protein